MATPINDPSGKPAPKGGFKLGGWYSGAQFDGTGFSQPVGVEAIGANTGIAVSAEVNLQADQAQGLTPGTIQSYLDNYQANVNGGLGSNTPAVRDTFGEANLTTINPLNFTDIKSSLTPTTAMPAPLNRTDSFNTLRTELGVVDMETQLNDFKAQQREIDAQLRTNKISERGKPVAMNVIEGRISKETQQAQEQYDFIGRQIASITDQLTTANNTIGMYMNFQNLDYQDAVTRYNTEFSQNLQVIDLVRNLRKDQITEEQRQIDNARANLTVFTNAITSGNMDPANLSSDQKLQIQRLEVQSGLPVGFTQSLRLSAKDRIISTSTSNGVTSVVMTDAAGNLSVKKVGTPTGSGASLAALDADLAKKMTLDQAIKKYSNLSPDTVYAEYNKKSPWGQAKESAETLKANYNITATSTETKSTASQISKAKQLIISNKGSDDDLKRVETDPNFLNWVIATYGG